MYVAGSRPNEVPRMSHQPSVSTLLLLLVLLLGLYATINKKPMLVVRPPVPITRAVGRSNRVSLASSPVVIAASLGSLASLEHSRRSAAATMQSLPSTHQHP